MLPIYKQKGLVFSPHEKKEPNLFDMVAGSTLGLMAWGQQSITDGELLLLLLLLQEVPPELLALGKPTPPFINTSLENTA